MIKSIGMSLFYLAAFCTASNSDAKSTLDAYNENVTCLNTATLPAPKVKRDDREFPGLENSSEEFRRGNSEDGSPGLGFFTHKRAVEKEVSPAEIKAAAEKSTQASGEFIPTKSNVEVREGFYFVGELGNPYFIPYARASELDTTKGSAKSPYEAQGYKTYVQEVRSSDGEVTYIEVTSLGNLNGPQSIRHFNSISKETYAKSTYPRAKAIQVQLDPSDGEFNAVFKDRLRKELERAREVCSSSQVQVKGLRGGNSTEVFRPSDQKKQDQYCNDVLESCAEIDDKVARKILADLKGNYLTLSASRKVGSSDAGSEETKARKAK